MIRSVASNQDYKRQKILDAAAALFASASFESARLQDVAAACNTSKSAFYHYFPSKEVLLPVINLGSGAVRCASWIRLPTGRESQRSG